MDSNGSVYFQNSFLGSALWCHRIVHVLRTWNCTVTLTKVIKLGIGQVSHVRGCNMLTDLGSQRYSCPWTGVRCVPWPRPRAIMLRLPSVAPMTCLNGAWLDIFPTKFLFSKSPTKSEALRSPLHHCVGLTAELPPCCPVPTHR